MKSQREDISLDQPTLDLEIPSFDLEQQEKEWKQDRQDAVTPEQMHVLNEQVEGARMFDNDLSNSDAINANSGQCRSAMTEADDASGWPGGIPDMASAETYDRLASQVLKSVQEFAGASSRLARRDFTELRGVFTLYLMGLQNPERHAAFLEERGVKLQRNTSPELATAKAMYPKELWEAHSPTLDNWKRAIKALHLSGVLPKDVPQWMRNPIADEGGKEVVGYKKVNFVLRSLNSETNAFKPDLEEEFNTLFSERVELPVTTVSAEDGLATATGYGLMIYCRDKDNVKILDVISEPGLARKIALKRWR